MYLKRIILKFQLIKMKVIETNIDYYLYISNSRSLIVGKDNLSKKDIEILTGIFKDKVSTYIYKKNV